MINTQDIVLSGSISSSLYSGIAEAKAEYIASIRKVTDRQGREKPFDGNKSTQLRKFYDELVMWNEKVQRSPEKYNDYAPLIHMLAAKVAYAKARKHVDESFEKLFKSALEQVNDAETLKRCKLFFEAFMGFYRGFKD